MKITSVDIIDVANDLQSSTSKWRPVVVKINTDEGICGYGEVGMAYGVVLAGCIAAALFGGWLLMSAHRHLPGWGHVIADLKAAIVLAEKNGVRGVAR